MAEVVFTGGNVVTVSGERPEEEALAMRDGRIVAVGEREEVLAGRAQDAIVVDLAGGALLPGFVEAHGHPLQVAETLAPPALDVRPFGTPTAEGVERHMREAVRVVEPGEPLVFFGIDILLQQGLRLPSITSLDELAPDNPVVVIANSGHAAYGNSLAFRVAGITRNTRNPIGAEYVRGPNGELTGEVREAAAVLALAMPSMKSKGGDLAPKLLWACKEYAKAGLTTVTEMAYDPRTQDTLTGLAAQTNFPVRLRVYQMGTPELAADADHKPGQPAPIGALFGQTGMKLWACGSPWQGNVATSFPYLDTPVTHVMGLEPHHRGGLNYTPEQILELTTGFNRQGWQLACHVHGDLGVDVVLDAYEAALQDTPRQDHRLRLEHCGAMTPEQFDRAARLGVTVSLFIQHVYYWGDVLVDGLFGQEHGAPWMATRSALDNGLRVSFHNDGFVTPADPLGNIATAVTRKARGSGRVLAPEQRIAVDEAIRAQTLDAAWQVQLERDIGSLEVGKRADLVVLSANPRRVDPDEIGDIEVRATFLGGLQTSGQSLA